ncbi:TIGR04283 family arsenosugar biosynthesis glycosyltransferase [Geminocystis sp. GBBB08]|uniref:TIGR04283 family arsenosugar biosynthesis glycosyltransferase n=1 Tax=Geminocystis sp. GBBB08 TaxID=2604140 RepID=UPI0027E26F5D|nr:TIGR04283 family arsenosugar biosynthesis glycosyltransferase [Geminocystis sp. GBBB08]MBL1209459.1 glycosyltransferase [Geminocystis sp. GBBB08]
MIGNYKISVIIPVINEEKNLPTLLLNLQRKLDVEFIFVDGGSNDNTVNLIKNAGFKIILSPILRRSYQMNLGAKQAQSNILLFLHGDTILSNNYDETIINILEKNNFVAGAFKLKIDSQKPIFRVIETLVNWRSQYLLLPYGDQGIFIKKEIFESIKGYQDLAIMEDFDLIKRLKKKGKIYIANASVTTSARRWEKLGIFKTTLINQLVILGYYLKIKPEKLALFYRQIK